MTAGGLPDGKAFRPAKLRRKAKRRKKDRRLRPQGGAAGPKYPVCRDLLADSLAGGKLSGRKWRRFACGNRVAEFL